MKIEATCNNCHRPFLLGQVGPESDTPGRCPFCGTRFARHYNAQLIEIVDAAEQAAGYFVKTLNRVQDMETGFDIDIDDLFDSLKKKLHEDRPEPVGS